MLGLGLTTGAAAFTVNVTSKSWATMSVPLTVTEIEASSLRETDRSLLKEGVAVRTREELMALLEDLGS